jgi:hypothetical protein
VAKTLSALRFLVAALLSIACDKNGGASAKPGVEASAAIPSPTLPAASVETSDQRIDRLGFAGALAYARPQMEDTMNKASEGGWLLAGWAIKHMKWEDVSVQKDETSFALVRKDSDEARTKRLCISGQIIEISIRRMLFQAPGDAMAPGGRLSEGLLMTNAGNIYQYLAAGSSGELVAKSPARFCGVVIGKYDYSNSSGGAGHAVALVGMFDLPENKTTVVDAAPASL